MLQYSVFNFVGTRNMQHVTRRCFASQTIRRTFSNTVADFQEKPAHDVCVKLFFRSA